MAQPTNTKQKPSKAKGYPTPALRFEPSQIVFPVRSHLEQCCACTPIVVQAREAPATLDPVPHVLQQLVIHLASLGCWQNTLPSSSFRSRNGDVGLSPKTCGVFNHLRCARSRSRRMM